MKKFITIILIVIIILAIYDISFYRLGFFIDLNSGQAPTTFIKSEGKKVMIKEGNEYKEFEIKGVDLGAGTPGKFATDFAIDKDTYKRWFKQMQEMGANTIRIYTILSDDFYNAFYEYNKNNKQPLYLLHGLWVNDYIQFSHKDAYDDAFLGKFLDDSRVLVDIIHGRRVVPKNSEYGNGSYTKDISNWTIGYTLGVEWEDVTVSYTDHKYPERNTYSGNYMYTTEDASPFEAMLAQVGDKIIEYESKKYKTQRLVAFSNWVTTDPLDYSDKVSNYFFKIAKVDVEHIKLTDKMISGTFAAYHVYPYFPDFLSYEGDINQYRDETGEINTYKAYLKKLVEHHAVPVIITEFGVPSSRGMAQRDKNTGRNQGGISEIEQGQAIVKCYNDIKSAGCAGSIIFTWQNEWFKRTWNTMNAVDLLKTPFWSDFETNEQSFGLLSFDPGEGRSISYVDGDIEEWKEEDVVIRNNDKTLSMKYDEKFIYLLVNKKDYSEDDILYIPIDTTPKTGSRYCENYNLKFENEADFVVIIDGKENSRIMVQERYEILRAMYNREVNGISAYIDIPDLHTSLFKEIHLLLQTATPLETGNQEARSETYETGKLRYGNANPNAENFNSIADFYINGDYIEIKLPWHLLNFSNPSEMKIHDDYYEKYGVEEIQIDKLYIGIGEDSEKDIRISMKEKELVGWKRNVTYHERLKHSYYIVKDMWSEN